MRKWTLILILSSISMTISAQTLEMAVQHALVSNPEILQNKAKSLAAAEAVRRAEAAYMPTVDVKGSLGREQTQTPITSAIGGAQSDDPMTRKETALEINQNIFSGFALTGEAQRLYHAWRAQEFKTLGIAEDLVLDVSEKYLDVLRNQQLLILARNNLNEHKAIYEKIEVRANAGLSRRAELEQARSRLSLAHANYLSVENDLRDAKVSFIRIVGQPAHNLKWPRVPSSRDLPRTLQNAIQQGIDNHPTLLSAHADVLEAKAQHKVANAENYPKIDLYMDVRQNRNLDGLFGMNNEKLALVRLSYNLYRGGADLAKQRETAYQIQEAYELKNNAVLQIEEKVRLSWYAWLTAGSRIHYLTEHVDAAFKTREAYIEQFKIGKRSLLDVVDSQNELYQAKIAEEQGHFDEVFARYRILNAEGALFPYLKGRLPVSVHNSDFATSHERINHSWLDQPLNTVPAVDIPGRELRDESLKPVQHPNTSQHKYYQTTDHGKPLYEKTWFVYVRKYRSPVNALEMVRRLKALSMKANLRKAKGRETWVYLGPYTFRSQAGLAMNRLQKRTGIKGSVAVRNQLVDIDTQIIGQRKLKGVLRAITLSKDDATIPQIMIEHDGSESKTDMAVSEYDDIPSPVAPSNRPPLRYLNNKRPVERKKLPEPPTFKTSQLITTNNATETVVSAVHNKATTAKNHIPILPISLLNQLELASLNALQTNQIEKNHLLKPPLRLEISENASKQPEEIRKSTTRQNTLLSFKTQLSRYFPFSLFKEKKETSTESQKRLQGTSSSHKEKRRYRLSLNTLIEQHETERRDTEIQKIYQVPYEDKTVSLPISLYPEVLKTIFNQPVMNPIEQITESNTIPKGGTILSTKSLSLSLIPTNELFIHTLPSELKLSHTKISKNALSKQLSSVKPQNLTLNLISENQKPTLKKINRLQRLQHSSKKHATLKDLQRKTKYKTSSLNIKKELNTTNKLSKKQNSLNKLAQKRTHHKVKSPQTKKSSIATIQKKHIKQKQVVHVHLEAIHKPDYYSLR